MKYRTIAATVLFLGSMSGLHALPDWPMFTGPAGNWDNPATGVMLTDQFSSVPRLWTSEAKDIPGSKLSSDFCGSITNLENPMSGGSASLIVGGDMVFCRFFVPNGDVWHAACSTSATSAEIQARLSIEADEVLLAVDAFTGKTRWRAVESRAGASRPPSKRGGAGESRLYTTREEFTVWALPGRCGHTRPRPGKKSGQVRPEPEASGWRRQKPTQLPTDFF